MLHVPLWYTYRIQIREYFKRKQGELGYDQRKHEFECENKEIIIDKLIPS